jgi:hypothetical protein
MAGDQSSPRWRIEIRQATARSNSAESGPWKEPSKAALAIVASVNFADAHLFLGFHFMR